MPTGPGGLSAELTRSDTSVPGERSQISLVEHLGQWTEINGPSIRADAAHAQVDYRDLDRHVRLHLPSVPFGLLEQRRYREAYYVVRHVAKERAAQTKRRQEDMATKANMTALQELDLGCKRDLSLEALTGARIPLRFGRVKPSVGNEYQAKLHYLQAVRGDTYLHFGIFLPDAEYPMAYIAVSACDRPYMVKSFSDSGYGVRDFFVLTRMYGLPGLPANLMSLMTRYLIRALRDVSKARGILTAYNPLLGFSGSVYRASGFREFAEAPVGYGYDSGGRYTTRRLANRDVRLSEFRTPPNILMARGMDRITQVGLGKRSERVSISETDYWDDVHLPGVVKKSEQLVNELQQVSVGLAVAWSDGSIDRRIEFRAGFGRPCCGGLCSVSSVWLVRELKRRFHVEATYCYGTVLSAGTSPRYQAIHSWVQVTGVDESDHLVIDLVPEVDRVSGGRQVVCDTHALLASRGLIYRVEKSWTIDELPEQPVWPRFEALDDVLHEQEGAEIWQ